MNGAWKRALFRFGEEALAEKVHQDKQRSDFGHEMTLEEVAKLFHVTKRTIMARVRRNELPPSIAKTRPKIWSRAAIEKLFVESGGKQER